MRYVIRHASIEAPGTPGSNDWVPTPMLPALSVDAGKKVDTGLVDRFGNSIMRVQAPIGFGRDGEH